MPKGDVARVIQGLITGVGFLGGGTILKLTREREIRVLTTAAGIWLTAAASIAAGLGEFVEALVGLLFALIVLVVIGRLGGPSCGPQRERTDGPAKPLTSGGPVGCAAARMMPNSRKPELHFGA